MEPPLRVLVVSHSLSGQTARCVDAFVDGLGGGPVQVERADLACSPPFKFPWGVRFTVFKMIFRDF